MKNIGFIGAGKVGFSLGKLFCEEGVHVTGYYSRHKESAEEAAKFTDTRCYDLLEEVVNESDVIFLTVPDGAISTVYETIIKRELNIRGKILCHCSGAMSSEQAFPNLKELGGFGYSVHPLFPISSRYDSYRELKDAFFCLEGDETYLNKWKEFFKNMNIRTRSIEGRDKVKYHAACAISSNLMCALMKISVDMLGHCGFEENEALEALTPLVRNNTEHMVLEGPVKALTGPVERCDITTIEKHISCFDSELDRSIYINLSEKLIEVAKCKNKDRDYSELVEMIEKRR